MNDAEILAVILSEAWQDAIRRFSADPKWKKVFDDAPKGAKTRIGLNFWLSCSKDDGDFDRSLYLRLRKAIESKLSKEDLEYLISTADKDALKSHYQAMMDGLSNPQVENPARTCPSLTKVRYIQSDVQGVECLSLELDIESHALEILQGEDETFRMTLADEEADTVVKMANACNFIGWNRTGPDWDESDCSDNQNWQLTLSVTEYPEIVIEGHGCHYAEWDRFLDFASYCATLLNVTDGLYIPGMGHYNGEAKEKMQLAFHEAFTCKIPYQSSMRTQGEYTVAPLEVPNAAGCRNPSLCPWENPECMPCGKFSNEKIGFGFALDHRATGFAVMKGRTLVFIYLGGSYEDAARLLRDMPKIETTFTPGVPTDQEAMQKIAMILSGAALFNWETKDVPYAYTGHQEGIWTAGQAYLTKDERLDYFWTGCNSDVFIPRFSQIGT